MIVKTPRLTPRDDSSEKRIQGGSLFPAHRVTTISAFRRGVATPGRRIGSPAQEKAPFFYNRREFAGSRGKRVSVRLDGGETQAFEVKVPALSKLNRVQQGDRVTLEVEKKGGSWMHIAVEPSRRASARRVLARSPRRISAGPVARRPGSKFFSASLLSLSGDRFPPLRKT